MTRQVAHDHNLPEQKLGARTCQQSWRYPFLKKLFADGGYQGPIFAKGQNKTMPGLATEIVKRSDTAKDFEVLPRRWVVERTFAWLGR